MNEPAASEQTDVELPEVITRYQGAHDRHDTNAAVSTFTHDARVVDEDREYHGTSEIRHWLETAGGEYTYTRTYLGATATTRHLWIVHNRLDGNFPGNTVDLRYRFALRDGLISELVIAP
jgi:hypothetical protein